MKVDSGHRNWAISTAVLLAGSAALYWIASRTSGHGGEHAGGSIAGLAFGIAGAGLIVFAALLVIGWWLASKASRR